MKVSPINRINRILISTALIMTGLAPAYAQQSAPANPVATATTTQSQGSAPAVPSQIHPIAHRLNGLKVLNFLRRNGVKVAPLSDDSLMKDAVQTNILAGLLLGDGDIVARLPRADLEVSSSPNAAVETTTAPEKVESKATLVLIERDGNELSLKFMGLDGGTGLSLLSAGSSRLTTNARDVKDVSLVLGQRVRLISPISATNAEPLSSTEVFVKIDVVEGRLTNISRATSGRITRLTIKAPKLSPELVGAVVVNDAGETVGLVDAVNGNEAQVIPISGVRRAVERIRLGLASKPRPWLGARGVSVANITQEQLELTGWKPAAAANLITKQIGVVLTAVPPQTPAAAAKLRVGDVVTRINDGEIRSAEEFSTLLGFVGVNAAARLTIVRPDRMTPRVVSVKLNVSLNPVLEMEAAEQSAARSTTSDPLVARGIETLPITSELATQLKVRGGLFVVFVHPDSAASRAGLAPGDVIESIDGKLLTDVSPPSFLANEIALQVVRNGHQLTIQVLIDDDKASRPKP